MRLRVEVNVAEGYRFEADGAPDSLDREAVEEFLEGLDLPDGWSQVEFTDLESGDFAVIARNAQ